MRDVNEEDADGFLDGFDGGEGLAGEGVGAPGCEGRYDELDVRRSEADEGSPGVDQGCHDVGVTDMKYVRFECEGTMLWDVRASIEHRKNGFQ